ncbi:NADP-dependent oxidoreductase [Nocardioides massiliensis]|uniref:NADPH-dependent curcumin reductase CurA n=1 Tax=Nocardioides massiliensis TaxID=1325935 RepID=A0ABT9NRA9_9ACTN|nr:NADP-dependent oxidoreductase [Nocardioides massiliensis]MDP9822967.1 NADPH-dependent curcumin reductase CurA [Nocardioides massiliensis]
MSTSTPTSTREIHLASRPQGVPTPDNFRMVEAPLPAELGEGEVLVRNVVMSVDPYMRGRMNDARSYVEPYALDAPLEGGAVGEVLASADPRVSPGDHVVHGLGWREHAVLAPRSFRPVGTERAPASAYLGVLGMPGLTAYVGLTRIARLQEGERVYVSGAAGAVGSLVGQIARNLGAAQVVGSAGSEEKVALLTDQLGFDHGFNYKDGSLSHQLRDAFGDGIDVYFDNVGGSHLEAALTHMRDFGRLALCGAISQYDLTSPEPGPRNLFLAVQRRLELRGFIVTDHPDANKEYLERATAWLAEGRLHTPETFVDGLDNAIDAFLGLGRGDNIGKMLVRLG